jgi:hypothetical protein
MRRLKAQVRTFAGTTLLFTLFVGVGAGVTLLIANSFGYLPYSDRPGPGWRTSPHWPTWDEAKFYVGFIPWFCYFSLFYGMGFFFLGLLLALASAPRWIIRTTGGIIGALSALIAITGAGWYLAIAPIVPEIAAFLGLVYGVLLFPQFVAPRQPPPTMRIRAAITALALLTFLALIVWPLLPRAPQPGLAYSLIRVTPGPEPLEPLWQDTPSLAAQMKSLRLAGEPHSGISGTPGSESNVRHVELVVLEPIAKPVTLPISKTGDMLYVLRSGVWTAYPAIESRGGASIILRPGSDADFDGAQLKLDGERDFHAFTWYPTIPKGQ